jgi:hypothetical protein
VSLGDDDIGGAPVRLALARGRTQHLGGEIVERRPQGLLLLARLQVERQVTPP